MSERDLRDLNVRPPPDHPIFQIPCEISQWQNQLERAIVQDAEAYGLVHNGTARRHLMASHHGELAARVYLSARPDRLEGIVHWFSWIFFLDDAYDGPIGRPNLHHVDVTARMLRAMPLASTEPPADDDSLARLLAATWVAVSCTQSTAWLARFYRHVAEFLEGFRFESIHRSNGLVPSMLIFRQVRRPASSVPACLDMLEYATGMEVPPLIYRTDQFRTMHTATVDVVAWLNDVLSLDKELAQRDVNNGVLILMRDRGCGVQEAVDLVYQRVAVDLEAFIAAEDELRRLCQEWLGLTAAERSAVDECVLGMRRWMRGNLDWSMNSERYRVVFKDGDIELHA